jgi:hypothetical protein
MSGLLWGILAAEAVALLGYLLWRRRARGGRR